MHRRRSETASERDFPAGLWLYQIPITQSSQVRDTLINNIRADGCQSGHTEAVSEDLAQASSRGPVK